MLMLFDVLDLGAVREPLTTGNGSFWRRYGVRGMSQLTKNGYHLVRTSFPHGATYPLAKIGVSGRLHEVCRRCSSRGDCFRLRLVP